MLHHIRPWQLFAHLNGNREVHYTIPSHRGTESETIMSLETLCLVSAARIVNAKTILELGTGLGYNALHLAKNTDAFIWTVDKTAKPFVFLSSEYHKRIISCIYDVQNFPPRPMDMVFCDINYSAETTKAATELAFACNPKVIGWHDFGHPWSPHQVPYLEGLAAERDLYHIEDSWTVLWFNEPLADMETKKGR